MTLDTLASKLMADIGALTADASPSPSPSPTPVPTDPRPAWARNAPLNTWIDVPGTRPKDIALPKNPTAAGSGYYYTENNRGGALAAWSGPSFQRKGSIFHLGPSGGHTTDFMGNPKQRIVLGVETPYSEWEDLGTPGEFWYTGSVFWPNSLDVNGNSILDGVYRPGSLHTYYSRVFNDVRGWDMCMMSQAIYGTISPPAGYPYANVANPTTYVTTFDSVNKAWLAPATVPNLPFSVTTNWTCCAVHPTLGDVFFGGTQSQKFWRWISASNTWQQLKNGNPAYGYTGLGIDVANDVMIQCGITPITSLKPYTASMTDGTRIVITFTGDPADIAVVTQQTSPSVATGYPGIMEGLPGVGAEHVFAAAVYDGVNLDGHLELYKLHRVSATTYAIEKLAASNPPVCYRYGILTKFQAAPELGGYVYMSRIDQPVKFIRCV